MSGSLVGSLIVLFGVKHNKEQFKAAHHALHTLRAAAAVFSVAHVATGLVHMAAEAAESATHIHSLSTAMGMSMAMTQRWTYVAEQSGSNLKELSVGVSMLQGNLRKLANGTATPKLRQFFTELGVTRKDAELARDQTDGVNAALNHMSISLKKMGTTGKASADMRAIVGARAGRALTADLIGGPENIQKMFKNVEAKGGIISDKSLTNLQAMYDGINDVKKAWHGVSGEILGTMAPALTKILNDISSWFVTNRETIGTVLLGAFEALSAAVKVLMFLFDQVAQAFKQAFDGDISMQAILITLAAVIVSLVIPSVIALGVSLWTALAPLLAPALIFAALLVIVLAVRKYWTQIVDFLSGVVGSVIHAIEAVGDWIVKHWKLIFYVLFGLFPLIVKAYMAVGRWLLSLGPRIIDAFKAVGAWFIDLGKTIWHGIGGVWDKIMKKVHKVIDVVLAGINKVKDALKWFAHVATFGQYDIGDQLRQYAPKDPTNPAAASGAPSTTQATAQPIPGLVHTLTPGVRGQTSVNVGPTTITINGVKNAAEAKDEIADSIDGAHRNALHGFGGEVD